MPRARMKVSLPRLTFLSWAIRSIRRSASGRPPATCDRRVGRPTAARWRVDALGLRRRQAARAARRTRTRSAMPSAIASPCSSRSEKPAAASKAWPKVWPRLSSARSPVSRSSRADDLGLHRGSSPGDRVLARRPRRAGKHLAPVGFEPGEERGVAEQAVFGDLGIAGAELARAAACRAARCRRPPGSAGGRRRPGSCRGGESIAVLPPTEESTCASSVVGTCT